MLVLIGFLFFKINLVLGRLFLRFWVWFMLVLVLFMV